MTNRLVLHCGAGKANRDEVYAVATPQPTKTWMPISHGQLLDQVENTLDTQGYQILERGYGLTRDGARLFALLQVKKHSAILGDDHGLVVGVRNSHDKSFPAGLVLGARVFVCDNLSFSGEVTLSRKHTVRIWQDLPALVNLAISQLTEHRQLQERRILTYKQSELSDGQANDLIIRAALDAKVLPKTKIAEVVEEWRAPRHIEFREGGKTAWRLFNAFTEILKGNLVDLPKRTQVLHGLMDSTVGVVNKVYPIAEYRESDVPAIAMSV